MVRIALILLLLLPLSSRAQKLYTQAGTLVADSNYRLTPRAFGMWVRIEDSVVNIVRRNLTTSPVLADNGIEFSAVISIVGTPADSSCNVQLITPQSIGQDRADLVADANRTLLDSLQALGLL